MESSIILSYVDIGNDLLSERVELADAGSWIAFNYHVTVFLDFVREWMAWPGFLSCLCSFPSKLSICT